MSWIFLSLTAAFVWAITNIIDKYVLSSLVRRPILPIMATGVVGALVALVVLLTHGVQVLSVENALLALLAGVFYIADIFFYFYAAQMEEISRVIPLFYLGALFTAVLAAIFLGEVFTLMTYVGIVLLVLGALLISSRGLRGLHLNRAFLFMVFAALTSTVSIVIGKYLLSFTDFWTVFAYGRLGALLPLIPVIFLQTSEVRRQYQVSGLKPFVYMTVSELLNSLGILLFTFALTIGFVTLVNALASVQPFFVLVLASIVSVFYPSAFREELRTSTLAMKVTAIALMFLGALLVT